MSTLDRELSWIPLAGAPGAPAILATPFPERAAGDITELTSSIRIHGVLSPILLRVTEAGLQIICGQRRWLAARAAGLDCVPAQIAHLTDAQAIRCYLAESLLDRPLSEDSRSCAFSQLEELRDGMPAPPQPRAPGAPSPRRLAVRASGPESARLPGQADTATEVLDADSALARAAVRARACFEEIRATRRINVPRTEILVDTLLELWQAGAAPPVSLAGVHRVSALDPVADHSLLTTFLAVRLLPGLAWDEEAARQFVIGTFLHDAGMVFVLDGAWGEARPLRQSERSEVESHTRIGHALVAGTREWDEEVAALARDHHERWNGTGYPGRASGTEVSLPCRLLGVIDAYAAMVSPRPHRDAMTPAHARSRMLRAMEMGVFDPALSTVLGSLDPEGGRRPPRPVWGPGSPAPRISVELGEALTTMRASEST
jgi:hypothetical protein